MANINTSNSSRDRDFSSGAAFGYDETFNNIYNYVINKLQVIKCISDQVTFDIEMNKLRKVIRKLLRKYFDKSLSTLATQGRYSEVAKSYSEQIQNIERTFNI
jgi:hypothetical protein